MSFQISLSDQSKASARFIRRVHREIQKAFSLRSKEGLTQQQLATKLQVNRATINKRLQGRENLTLRTIAELAWALDHDAVFDMAPRTKRDGANTYKAATKPSPTQPVVQPASGAASSWTQSTSKFTVRQEHNVN